ncbi:MAG: sigma-70 family RNA polymerase sigma factor [Ruminococcus sp.]|nr:sigma-70 family RNA polymerase sigma factor [Ruminococcus sp.]
MTVTDTELLQLLKNDNEKGFRALMEKYTAYIFKIAYSKLSSVSSREDIEEAVSDIFVMFYRYALKKGFDIPSVGAYMGVIAKRRCINIYNSKIKGIDALPLEDVEDFLGSSDSSQLRLELIDAIESLGAPDSEIIMRKFFLGQKSREIAKDLGMKRNTVDKTISRSLKKLKIYLQKE